MKTTKPRYTIKQYIWLAVLGATLSLLFDIIVFGLLGAPCRLLLITVIGFYSAVIYVILKGFHGGLVEHYGLQENGVKAGPGRTGDNGSSQGKVANITKPHYSAKQYIRRCILGVTGGFLAVTIILSLLGVSCRLLLTIVVVLYPVTIYVTLKRFYEWLVKQFGFKENKGGQE